MQRVGDTIGRRPVIVVAEDGEDAASGLQMPERAAKRIDVPMHRVRAGKIVSGEKNQVRMLAVDRLDRQEQPRQVLIAVHVKVADLARDRAAMRSGEASHRQVDTRDFDFVDRPAPHAMKRAQGQRRMTAPRPRRRSFKVAVGN